MEEVVFRHSQYHPPLPCPSTCPEGVMQRVMVVGGGDVGEKGVKVVLRRPHYHHPPLPQVVSASHRPSTFPGGSL